MWQGNGEMEIKGTKRKLKEMGKTDGKNRLIELTLKQYSREPKPKRVT